MCGMEWDSERKRQENWHLGKWRRGDRKERKHESTGECTEMKKKRRTIADLHLGNDKLDTSFHQTKLFIFFSISSSSLNVDIFQLSCPGSPALCFLSVFDKGDRGG